MVPTCCKPRLIRPPTLSYAKGAEPIGTVSTVQGIPSTRVGIGNAHC